MFKNFIENLSVYGDLLSKITLALGVWNLAWGAGSIANAHPVVGTIQILVGLAMFLFVAWVLQQHRYRALYWDTQLAFWDEQEAYWREQVNAAEDEETRQIWQQVLWSAEASQDRALVMTQKFPLPPSCQPEESEEVAA